MDMVVSMVDHGDNIELYEQDIHWNKLKDNQEFQNKKTFLKAIIPYDIKSILDAGCGDGSLTNELSFSFPRVTGIDRSAAALKYVCTDKVQADISHIPFDDNAFDLVLCCQVLEHLPDKVFELAIKELQRVSRKYLLIGVPYKENLAEHYTKCGNCKHIYHLWGHLRRFKNMENLADNFDRCKLSNFFFCSEMSYTHPAVLWLKHFIGNEWKWEETALCPNCNQKIKFKTSTYSKLVKYVTDRLNWRVGEIIRPWWLVVLLEKK
jgi:SAM-dependent methyltransferase